MNALSVAVVAIATVFTGSALAQDKLVAIDVLLEPDARMTEAAKAWNARLREQMPEGFALDETHRPHITLLQQYVAAKDLGKIVTAVKALAASADLSAMTLTATGLYHTPLGKLAVQGITIEPSPQLHALQAKVIDALAPFRRSGGGEAAFVPDPTGMPFVTFLIHYVDSFVEQQAGDKFNPHVTTGVGPLPWVEAREKEPFAPFTFGVDAFAVYRLGNFGTAAEQLGD